MTLDDELYRSEDDAYGRRLCVGKASEPCRFCGTTQRVVEVDSSDEEYLSFICCVACFSDFCHGEKK